MKRLSRSAVTFTLTLSLVFSACLSTALAEPANQPQTASANPTSNSVKPESDGFLITLNAAASASLQYPSTENDESATDTSSTTIRELNNSGLIITQSLTLNDGTAALVAKSVDNSDANNKMDSIREIAGVANVQPNYEYRLVETPAGNPLVNDLGILEGSSNSRSIGSLPVIMSLLPANDPFLKSSDPSAARPNQYWAYQTGLVSAWRQAKTNHSVTVAVMDTGALFEHEDLKPNLLTNLSWDTTTNSPIAGTGDPNGHGTFVSGVISGAANNGVGLTGASYNASILPIKVFSKNDEGNWRATSASFIAAYTYLFNLIDSGARTDIHVVNISAGGTATSGMKDSALEQIITKARNEYRIATVSAGGNTHSSDGFYPSDFDSVISVTATTSDGSDYPGADYNIFKDISAPGASVYSAFNSEANAYVKEDGTSVSSPIVAGTVALMFSKNPDATVDSICDDLYSTVGAPIEGSSPGNGIKGALNASGAISKTIDHLQAPYFPDSPSGLWFKGAVDFVSRRGIMNGDPNLGLFLPDVAITREQMAQVLYNYLGNGEIAPDANEADVSQGAFYSAAVNWAIAHRVMEGYDDGSNKFGIGDYLTRQQVARVFSNLLATDTELEKVSYSSLYALPDNADVAAWAKDSVAWSLNNSIIKGVDRDGRRWLEPNAPASRAAVATIMMNAIRSRLM